MIKLISPFRGEFGIKLMCHVPAVHAMEGAKVVVCEPGERCLYPSAAETWTCERALDEVRRDMYSKDALIETIEDWMRYEAEKKIGTYEIVRTDADMPRKYFKPQSDYQPVSMKERSAEIVMCPRWRQYGREKNWPHWNRLAWLLKALGIEPVMIGAVDSTDMSIGHGWYTEASLDDHGRRALDAAVWHLNNAKLCIATDAGLAHLAMWCGCPLLMITHGDDCRTAPGAVRLGDGTIAHKQYWPVKIERYREQNHLGVDLMMVPNGWHDPELVVDYANMYLKKSN